MRRRTRSTMASRARSKPSLTNGMSSHRSTRPSGSSTGTSHPKLMMCVAPQAPSDDAGRGTCPRTSIPSRESPSTTGAGIWSSGSSPADSARSSSPRSRASRLKCSAAMRLFAEPCWHTNRIVRKGSPHILLKASSRSNGSQPRRRRRYGVFVLPCALLGLLGPMTSMGAPLGRQASGPRGMSRVASIARGSVSGCPSYRQVPNRSPRLKRHRDVEASRSPC